MKDFHCKILTHNQMQVLQKLQKYYMQPLKHIQSPIRVINKEKEKNKSYLICPTQ